MTMSIKIARYFGGNGKIIAFSSVIFLQSLPLSNDVILFTFQLLIMCIQWNRLIHRMTWMNTISFFVFRPIFFRRSFRCYVQFFECFKTSSNAHKIQCWTSFERFFFCKWICCDDVIHKSCTKIDKEAYVNAKRLRHDFGALLTFTRLLESADVEFCDEIQ